MPVKTPIPYYPASFVEKVVQIKLNRPVENNLLTPATLPTFEPADGQLKKILQTSDFPQLIPENCLATYIGIFSILCKTVTAGTLYARIYKNGGLVASTSFSASANYFYHIQGWLFGVSPGDEINFKVWSSVSDSSYDFTAYQIQPTRVAPPEAINTPISISYGGIVREPAYSGANRPTGISDYGYQVYFIDDTGKDWSGYADLSIFKVGDNFRLFRIYQGDLVNSNSLSYFSSPSRGCAVYRNSIPTMIRLKIWKLA